MDEQLLIAQQELDREIEQLKQQEIAASRQGAKNTCRMREALQKRADNAEKCISQIRARQHSDEELARAAEAYCKGNLGRRSTLRQRTGKGESKVRYKSALHA